MDVMVRPKQKNDVGKRKIQIKRELKFAGLEWKSNMEFNGIGKLSKEGVDKWVKFVIFRGLSRSSAARSNWNVDATKLLLTRHIDEIVYFKM